MEDPADRFNESRRVLADFSRIIGQVCGYLHLKGDSDEERVAALDAWLGAKLKEQRENDEREAIDEATDGDPF